MRLAEEQGHIALDLARRQTWQMIGYLDELLQVIGFEIIWLFLGRLFCTNAIRRIPVGYRVANDPLIRGDDKSRLWNREEKLDSLKILDQAIRRTPIEVVDQHDKCAQFGLVNESLKIFAKRTDIERAGFALILCYQAR